MATTYVTSTLPTCAILSELASPQPLGVTYRLKGISHAIKGTGTPAAYSNVSLYVQSFSVYSA